METPPTSARGLTLGDWESLVKAEGHPAFRARQIGDWIYGKRVTDFASMTNLSQPLRSWLGEHFTLNDLETVLVTGSEDTTRKFLFRLSDRRLIETVLIPASEALYGEKSDRLTLCVSSQVGCAFDCRFCASGLAGFTRNLTVAEIVSQVLKVEELAGERVQNIVFMGMGEPLANFRNLLTALEILNAEWGVNIGARRITVSTSGLAPQIEQLAEISLQIRLAVSLHGASNEVRNRIMPVNRKYPLEKLFASLEVWRQRKKQKITFEYILIDGVNDDLAQARLLASRAKKLSAKVNLIPYNLVEGLSWDRPSLSRQQAFLRVLTSEGIQATLRKEKGHDIAAACGQLRLREETDEGIVEAAAKR